MPPVPPQGPAVLEAMDQSSLTMTMHIQMPLTATEMFLSSSATGPSWALWLIKIDTLSPAGEYHPHLMRLVKAASDGTPPVYLPSAPPAVAPRIHMKCECKSRVSGETLRRTEVADGHIFLVSASATPGLSHQIGPDQFGSPEEIRLKVRDHCLAYTYRETTSISLAQARARPVCRYRSSSRKTLQHLALKQSHKLLIVVSASRPDLQTLPWAPPLTAPE